MTIQEIAAVLIPSVVALAAAALAYRTAYIKSETEMLEDRARQAKEQQKRDEKYDAKLLDMAYDSNNRVEALEKRLDEALKDLASSKESEQEARREISLLRQEVDALSQQLQDLQRIRNLEVTDLTARLNQALADLKKCQEAQKE
jgi:hypothetical protein